MGERTRRAAGTAASARTVRREGHREDEKRQPDGSVDTADTADRADTADVADIVDETGLDFTVLTEDACGT